MTNWPLVEILAVVMVKILPVLRRLSTEAEVVGAGVVLLDNKAEILFSAGAPCDLHC